MAKGLGEYKSYLLRLWRSGDERSAWHASLEDSQDGARHGFATLEHLFAFLAQQADDSPFNPPSPRQDTAASGPVQHD